LCTFIAGDLRMAVSNRTTYRSVRIEQNQLVAQNALHSGAYFKKVHVRFKYLYAVFICADSKTGITSVISPHKDGTVDRQAD